MGIKTGTGYAFDRIVELKKRSLATIMSFIRPPPPPPPKEELLAMEEGRMINKPRLADTARLVMRTRRLMTNLQQLKAAAAATQQEDEAIKDEGDTLSMKSYGSHKNYAIMTANKSSKTKSGRKKTPVKVIEGILDDNNETEDDADNCDELENEGDEEADEDWEEGGEGTEDGEDQLLEDAPVPRRSVHSSHKPEEEEETPIDCFPPEFYERFPILNLDGTPFGTIWGNVRLKTFKLIENKYFETAVITMILLSSLALVSYHHFTNN